MARQKRSSAMALAAPTPKPKTHIISNIAYVKQYKEMLGKLKYFTFRDDRNDYISRSARKARRRWVDCGMGEDYPTIFNTCQALQSKDVLAWTYVISPDPTIMELVPERKRRALLEQVTESVVEEYYEARDENRPRYSYVIHDREASTNKQQLHSHIVLAGTVETMDGPQPFYNNRRDGHIELFNKLAEEVFERELAALGIQTPLEPVVAADIDKPLEPDLPEPDQPMTERERIIAEIIAQWDWSF